MHFPMCEVSSLAQSKFITPVLSVGSPSPFHNGYLLPL